MRTMVGICLVWALLVSSSFWWNHHSAQEAQQTTTIENARSIFHQLVLTRMWNASHSGVYVPITDTTQPNPYLEVERRDIHVDDKLSLTMVNPAFMTRQISELSGANHRVRFHLTSLTPVRPANRATEWERHALVLFEKGVPEVSETTGAGRAERLLYMAPLITEQSCLRCHARHGYRLGDICGGISVSIASVGRVPLLAIGVGHGLIGLMGLAGILFAALRIRRSYETIRQVSDTDPLTGVPNRRAFTDRLTAEIGRSRREHVPLSVLLADVDHFKLYNDTYGHQAGDKCLQGVANAIGSALRRPGDFCGRYGGEEFVIVLPQTGEEGAAAVAEAIRANVEALAVPHRASLTANVITISVGRASVSSTGDKPYEDLVDQADQAMYLAKRNGRNRVECLPVGAP